MRRRSSGCWGTTRRCSGASWPILKAGAAYVPFDPADPPERLAFMLEDARVSVLVTQQRFLQRLPESMAPAVCLDTDAAVIAREEQNNPVPRAAVDDLCYVMYTS